MSTHSRNIDDGSTEKPKATTNYRSVSRAESKGGDVLASSEQVAEKALGDVQNTIEDTTAEQTNTILSRVASGKIMTPGEAYDAEKYIYHYTADDHVELGRDLSIVICKVLLKTPENVERVNEVQQRFLQTLHGRHL